MSAGDYDKELFDAIEDLLRRGDLDKGAPAYGVAQKAIHSGYNSLTRMEKVLYKAVVVPALKRWRAEPKFRRKIAPPDDVSSG